MIKCTGPAFADSWFRMLEPAFTVVAVHFSATDECLYWQEEWLADCRKKPFLYTNVAAIEWSHIVLWLQKVG